MTTMTLTRTNEQVSSTGKNGQVALGRRGTLEIAGLSFYTIERTGGYVTLPAGEFECVMEQQPKHNNRRVFRVKVDGEHGHHVKNNRGEFAAILIHAANYPHQIVGCVAPGRTKILHGVGDSGNAMKDIFQACGGFGPGKKVTLVVKNPRS